VCLHVRLSDAFGDNGIIGVVIAKPSPEDPSAYAIDTWLMSCRVLGRGVERATLNVLAEAVIRRGARTLVGEYLPTPKNDLVRAHYEKLGFAMAGEGGLRPGDTRWRLELDAFTKLSTHIAVTGSPP
jgi:FkbH-like protein